MILTNELPKLGDASGALTSRFIMLRMTTSFYGREDRGLTDKLLTELPGILNWAIAGWETLKRVGHFKQPASAQQAMQQTRRPVEPDRRFCASAAKSAQPSRATLARCSTRGLNGARRSGATTPAQRIASAGICALQCPDWKYCSAARAVNACASIRA